MHHIAALLDLSTPAMYSKPTFFTFLFLFFCFISFSKQTCTSDSDTVDPYARMQIAVSSLVRYYDDPHTSPSSNPNLSIPVLSKDLTINQTKNTFVRLFLPKDIVTTHNLQKQKVPLLVMFYGSSFIMLSVNSSCFHRLATNLAKTVGAVVASVQHRLAPEHRFPAAYDDAMEALYFLRNTQDEWLTRYVNHSNCFIFGHSAGGTVAYFTSLRAAQVVDQLEPLKIQGLILRQPFFGGVKRTESELRLQNNSVNPLVAIDLVWQLALPIGANRDHEYCNFRVSVDKLNKIKELGWWVLVSGTGGDPLIDREIELAETMEKMGIKVIKDFHEEGYHGIESKDPEIELEVNELVRRFVFQTLLKVQTLRR